jgi:predicted small lipoprotein YifL
MLRDFLAGDRRSRGRVFGMALLAAVLAACAAGCGIKGPLRLPPPPAPQAVPPTPDATPTTPSEPDPAAPRKQ